MGSARASLVARSRSFLWWTRPAVDGDVAAWLPTQTPQGSQRERPFCERWSFVASRLLRCSPHHRPSWKTKMCFSPLTASESMFNVAPTNERRSSWRGRQFAQHAIMASREMKRTLPTYTGILVRSVSHSFLVQTPCGISVSSIRMPHPQSLTRTRTHACPGETGQRRPLPPSSIRVLRTRSAPQQQQLHARNLSATTHQNNRARAHTYTHTQRESPLKHKTQNRRRCSPLAGVPLEVQQRVNSKVS